MCLTISLGKYSPSVEAVSKYNVAIGTLFVAAGRVIPTLKRNAAPGVTVTVGAAL